MRKIIKQGNPHSNIKDTCTIMCNPSLYILKRVMHDCASIYILGVLVRGFCCFPHGASHPCNPIHLISTCSIYRDRDDVTQTSSNEAYQAVRQTGGGGRREGDASCETVIANVPPTTSHP